MGVYFKGITASCCYCGLRQPTEEPPALVTCCGCKRDFRIFKNAAGSRPMEISDEAKAVLARRKA